MEICTSQMHQDTKSCWNTPQVIVTAHAGDSDVCLLRFSQPQHSGQTPVLLWGKWLTKEHTMYSEEERERESAQGMKVKEREGAGNLAHKVMSPQILHA